MANLVAHPIEEDLETMTDLIQNVSMNILRILSVSSTNGNVLFDSHTLTDAAEQSINLMKEVAENVLTTIFPLHKIITILILILAAIVTTLIIILVIRYLLRRKKRTVAKRAITHLKSIMNANDEYITPEEAVINVNDVVMLIDSSTPRGKWPLGLVVKVYPGQDGVVRVVDVKIHDDIVHRRPVAKLVHIFGVNEDIAFR
jgi:hypothetical protein